MDQLTSFISSFLDISQPKARKEDHQFGQHYHISHTKHYSKFIQRHQTQSAYHISTKARRTSKKRRALKDFNQPPSKSQDGDTLKLWSDWLQMKKICDSV